MNLIYGYCRVSTPKQSIERQVENILRDFPNAKIYKEKYTGTDFEGQKALKKILCLVQSGDTIVFDSVSRMSRNAAKGIELYMELYHKGIELVFLKQPLINTSVYRQGLSNHIELLEPNKGDDEEDVGRKIANKYINTTNEVIDLIARKQIELAFEQSENEVKFLQQRTREGIEIARRNGKRIGTQTGDVLTVKKKAPAMKVIKSSSVRFGGTLNDIQCARAAGISNKTFYKYLAEIQATEE